MADKIKKIQYIRRMAVYQDFNWDKSIRDAGNNIGEFKKINLLYGRNYSGKTTLSRIIRAFETGVLSEKYDNPEFGLLLENNKVVTQDSLTSNAEIVRVFNEDFIKENLRFITDNEHNINSFAILGDDNNKLEEEIQSIELEIGSETELTGLCGKLKDATTAYNSADKNFNEASLGLENKLKDKANKTVTGIKHNKTFGDANYNVLKIKADIAAVAVESYESETQEQIDSYYLLLKEETKPSIPESMSFNLNFESFSQKTQGLLKKKITVSEPIQELINDAALQAWVRAGREYHECKRTICGFCGGELPKDLWGRLDKHFNKESEELRTEINTLLQQIEAELSRINKIIIIKNSDFYSQFGVELDQLRIDFEGNKQDYSSSIEELAKQLKQRKDNIFNSIIFAETKNPTPALNSICDRYEGLRMQSNQFTISLGSKQTDARTALRLNEVCIFIRDIKYIDECTAIERLKSNFEETKRIKDSLQNQINQKKQKIVALKSQLKDESKGAERVNDFLNNFFAHKYLSLKAIKNSGDEQEAAGYRFEVTRNSKKAYHLSEGECSLIAFCYFMAKLEDVETKGSKPIIWIDDPVSSLDANHIFFLYGLIKAEIITQDKFAQLFISTHNLDFLKYLKRLPGASNKKLSEYFIIQRHDESSSLQLMPGYLKNYVTEFNFLFHQIYKCAKANISTDHNHDCYYNFGNNARKFLEAFLYYKYPNAKKGDDDKLMRFFGNGVADSLTERISNEYSHLEGLFERSVMPIDVPEMKTTAQFILQKIKENDVDQYNDLLLSIDEVPESASSTDKGAIL